MKLKVIGAGFGRTGTDSMRAALDMLGFGPTHHMFEVMQDEAMKQSWRAKAQGQDVDWTVLLGGYSSCVDWPSVYYWRELVALNPEARVVLTWRSPESWYESFSKTILPFTQEPHDPQSLGRILLGDLVFDGRGDDRDHAIGVYTRHVEEVRATVPPERLLVHELGDGWAPLCSHLGVPIPDEPYPNSNSAAEFVTRNADS